MKYYIEKDLEDFEFWSGAIDVAKQINERDDSSEIWQILQSYLEECGDDMDETYINDFIWFEAVDYLKDSLGINIYAKKKENVVYTLYQLEEEIPGITEKLKDLLIEDVDKEHSKEMMATYDMLNDNNTEVTELYNNEWTYDNVKIALDEAVDNFLIVDYDFYENCITLTKEEE